MSLEKPQSKVLQNIWNFRQQKSLKYIKKYPWLSVRRSLQIFKKIKTFGHEVLSYVLEKSTIKTPSIYSKFCQHVLDFFLKIHHFLFRRTFIMRETSKREFPFNRIQKKKKKMPTLRIFKEYYVGYNQSDKTWF